MNIKLQLPELTDLKPRLCVIGVGGAGCNAVNNMIAAGLSGVEFVAANTDAQALSASSAEHRIQLGASLTEGLGAGAKPEIGEAAAEEVVDEIRAQISGAHMVFLAAGMGGGTGTGAASVIARAARDLGILTVAVVTKPFHFEGARRMRVAEAGIQELENHVDTLIVIPNQNLFRIANEKTTFAEAFVLADHVLYSGVACIVDLIIKEGLINLDFADVRAVLGGMGSAMMGTGEAEGENRATLAAEEAIANPLLDEVSLSGAKGLLLSIIGGSSLTLYEVDEAASRVRREVDPEANIIVGATFDETLDERIRVSIVASGVSVDGRPRSVRPPRAMRAPAPQDDAHAVQPAAAGGGNGSAPPEGGSYVPEHRPVLDWSSGRGQVQDQDRSLDGSSQVAPDEDAEALRQRLSDALQEAPGAYAGAESREDGHDPREPNLAGEPWIAPGNVVIEEGPPPVSNYDERLASDGSERGPDERYRLDERSAEQFTPLQPPEDIRGSGARMPTVEDFPAVAQREYRAKSAGHPHDDGGEKVRPRRLGIFERLTGFARRQSDSHEGVRQEAQDALQYQKSYAHGEAEAITRPSGDGRSNAQQESSEDSDLPVFFSRARRG